MSSPSPRDPAWKASLPDAIASVAWSPDESRVAALGVAGHAWVLDAATGSIHLDWEAHQNGGFRIDWHPANPDLLATSGQDGQVRLWNPASATPRRAIAANAPWVEHLAWSPNGTSLAAAAGKHLTVIPTDDAPPITFPPHPSTVAGIAWSSDSTEIATAAYGAVTLWNVRSGTVTAELKWKTSLISVAWSPNRRWVVAGTQEFAVQVWELPPRPDQELAMSGYDGKVRQLAWHPSGRWLATGGGSQPMIWDCSGRGPEGSQPLVLSDAGSPLTCLAWDPWGEFVLGSTRAGKICAWSPVRSADPQWIAWLEGEIMDLKPNPKGGRLLAGTQEGQLCVL